MFKLVVQAVLVSTVLGTTAAGAQTPSQVRIRSLTYAGSGCPSGTVASSLSQDASALTLLLDSFVAEVGPGVPLVDSRKNCQLVVSLDYPQGWSYALRSVTYRGYYALDTNVIARQTSVTYFQGSTQSATLRTQITGPQDRAFEVRDSLGLDSLVWSPCGANRSLALNTSVQLDNSRNRAGHGLLTIGELEFSGQQYGIVWKRCL